MVSGSGICAENSGDRQPGRPKKIKKPVDISESEPYFLKKLSGRDINGTLSPDAFGSKKRGAWYFLSFRRTWNMGTQAEVRVLETFKFSPM
jgi:hypothetical protein